jgi:hypothetical protein
LNLSASDFSILQPTTSVSKSKNICQSKKVPKRISLLVSHNSLEEESAILLSSLRVRVVVYSLPGWILLNF